MADENLKNIKWVKIKCSGCGVEKNASADRMEKLKAANKLSTYKCRDCRRQEKAK